MIGLAPAARRSATRAAKKLEFRQQTTHCFIRCRARSQVNRRKSEGGRAAPSRRLGQGDFEAFAKGFVEVEDVVEVFPTIVGGLAHLPNADQIENDLAE